MRLLHINQRKRHVHFSGKTSSVRVIICEVSRLSYLSSGIANWKKRTEIIQYCVAVVDQSIEDKQKTIETRELDADVEAQLKKASYAEAVRVGRNFTYEVVCFLTAILNF